MRLAFVTKENEYKHNNSQSPMCMHSASIHCPERLEFVLQNLRAWHARKACVSKRKLAHLIVVAAY